ncbi:MULTISPECIES: ArsR/SmtB family transcription factor [unclassified Mesorhizobium]|uniref:ArsR/SmtB family transcription factor n=1 Tax=unclassified Mesorhizobium TaxID=325217 RepID=UPI001CCCBE46|nr:MULTISPECIES: ArsR family transcriptional regulator [unclassified Mesorhizobium]MBZ9683886.1 ArsR family transcriptional regulator [Mesorhizobium sp. CO1-1-2]MBZ9699097.1 ArsR family transcriptional regulator [Mesorhizobium sp. CO1-1-9]MBZ9725385.1 ArsR family transcriptional regulator [Mesorhizobium sp. CO1-1-11]MBZ9923678.1 ArsR family transcriptional regulator [Mesorhizobium sp. BR1-1-4]
MSLASELFAPLGFRKRLLIVIYLVEGERSVSDLVALIGGSRTALSQHLSGMAKLGIVQARNQGSQRCYSCVSNEAKMLVRALSDIADRDKLPMGRRSAKRSSSWRQG